MSLAIGVTSNVLPVAISDTSITCDGTVQTILNRTASKVEHVTGWINVNKLQAGDTLAVIVTIDNQDGEGDVIHASELYEDAQTESAIYLVDHKIKAGAVIKATVQQTTGTNREIFYNFTRE